MAAHDLINAAIKANDKAMKTAIKQGYPVQLPANQYLPKAMNGNIDLIHLGQFADLDAGFDDYRKQQAAQQAQAASQDFSDLDAGFAEWSAGQGGVNTESMRISPVEAPRTASTSTGGQSTGSRSTKANTGAGTAQEEIPSLDNMAVPVTAKTTTKTAAKTTKAEKKAEKEVKQANSTLSKADKALQTAQKKQTVAENNLRKKLDRAENEAQKADAMRSAAKVTKKGNTTVIEPAQNVQQTKRKMQNLAKEEARAQAEYTKAQNDVRKAEERAKKAADRQQAANDRAQAASAFAARRAVNSGTVSSAEQVTNNAVRRDIIDQAVNNQISSYNAMPKANAIRGTSGRVHSGNGRTGEFQLPALEAPTVNTSMQRSQRDQLATMEGRLNPSAMSSQQEVDEWLRGDGNPVVDPMYQAALQQAVRADALKPKTTTMLTPAQAREMGLVPDEVIGQGGQPGTTVNAFTDQDMRTVWANPDYKLDDEEYARAKKMSEDYFKQNFRGPNDRYFIGNPADQTDGTVEEMSRIYNKTHQGAAFTGGVLNSAAGVGKIANRGAVKLAEQTGQDDLADALTDYSQQMDASIAGARTQHPVTSTLGTMAGKMAQYSATNPYFDSIAEASGLTGAAKFALNQGAQLAQDYAVSDLPQLYEDLTNEDLTTQQALRNLGVNTLQDAAGNLAMGALSDYIIPKLTGRGAIESAGDAARAVSNTPAPVDDSLDAALYGTGIMQDLSGADKSIVPELARPYDETNISADEWEYLMDRMTKSADSKESAEAVAPYFNALLRYESGRATLDEVDEAFNQAQFNLMEGGFHTMPNETQRMLNPNYSGPTAMYDYALRKFGEKYPEQAGAYRQAQDAYNAVINNPEATREEIIAAHEQLVKATNGFDGRIRSGEAAPRKAELNQQIAELKKSKGADKGTGNMKVYADPEWVEKRFGTKKKTAQERLKGTNITLVDDPRKASKNVPMMGQSDLESFLADAIRMQSEKNGLEVAVNTHIGAGKNSEKIRNFIYSEIAEQTNDSLRSHGYLGLSELSPEEQAIRDFEGEEWAAMVENWPESEWRPQAEAELRSRLAEIRGIAPEEVESPYLRSIAEDAGIPNQTNEVLDIGTGEIPSMEEIDNIAARRAELQARADGIDDVGGTFYDRHTGEVVPQEVVEQLDAELREANRQFDEAVANAPEPKDIGGVRPQTVDDSDELPFLDDSSTEPPENWQALFDEPAPAKSAEEAVDNGIPALADEADEVADTANHANRSNNVTMTEEELDEAIADTPPLGPKVDPVERLREKLSQQTNESREYIGRARTNTMARSGIDDLYEQEEVIPEKLFTVMSTPERMSVDNAYGRATNNKEAELERFGKNILTKEEIGGIGGEDVDTMFILRNMLNKQAEAATDEAVKADLYARSRIIALNLNNVAHRGGETVQSFSKWTRTFDGMMTVAEGRLQRQISDVLENNPHMKAEIDTMAHKIFDRIGELDNGEDLRTQVHDIVREVLGDSKYLKGKVDDSTITKLTDSLLKEKSFTNLQDQLDYLATGYHPISPETLDRVQELFDEMDQFNYDSKEYFKREQEVYRLLANEIYAKGGSFRDKFDQWRYFAMLANPTTHLKNIMGNVLFGQGAVSTKNGLAALIEEGADRVSKATGGKGIKRTKALLNPKADADLIAAARKDGLENAYRELAGTSRYMDMATGVERVKPAFNPNSKIGSKINRAMDINNRALSGEDELAMIAKYQTSLAGYLKANGKTADIFNATDKESLQFLEDARAYAIRQAEEAAFHQDSVFAKNFSQFTRNLRESESELSKGVGTLMDVAVPFKKTPINILKTCFSYSPLGLARVAKDTYRVAKGTMSGAEMIDDLSKVLTGTAGIAAGALLAHLGIVQSGMGRGEKEQTFDKTTGRQSNAIRIGKSSIGLAELVPAAAPIIYGAIIYDARRMNGEEGNNALDNIVNGLSGVAEATTDMTMLSGFSDILADARSAQGKAEAFKNIGGGLVGNLVGQMFPTVGRKAEITIDDTKRSTYSEKSGSMKNIDSTRKYLQTKIPGSQALGEKLEQSEIPALQAIGDQLTLEPAINAWGQEIKQTGGNVLGRAAYNFLSPVTLSTVSDDPVDQELYALGDATGADEIHHTMPQADANYTDADGNKAKLSEKQWTQYQIENGTRAHEILEQLFQSDAYKSMSDGDKVDAIKRVYSYTKDYALNKVGGKVMNSSTAKLQAAYEEGGVEGVIGELTYLNDLNAAKAETGMDISNNAKAREVYAQFGQEGLTDYKMLGSQFDEIKAAREAVLGKGSTNVDIMSNLTLLNENPDKEDLIIGALVKNPDKYEKTSNGWVYHKGDSVIQADDIKPGNTEGTIPQLESGTTEAPAEINPATGRPVAPTRQTVQAEPAVEIDPRTGRPKAPSRSNEVIQPQGEIPKLEPNGDATWNNSWKIENSKSYGRFRQVDPSYNASDYARVYNAMDTDNSGKLKKAEIQSYLDAMSGVDEAYRWAMFNAFAQSNWSNPYKK